MAEQTTAQETSATHTLVGPSGFRAVFNDQTDSDFVFPLTGEDALTGLDSPEVRAALYDRIEAHGAIAGTFYHGIRPITFSGELLAATKVDRNARESKLRKVVNNCMAADGTWTWTPSGSVSQFVKVRKYQPMRVRGGWKKDVFGSLVCPDPFIYSTTLNTVTVNHSTDQVVENQGNDFGPPVLLRVHGPGTNPVVRRTWGGVTYDINMNDPSFTLAANEFIDIDPVRKTIKKATDAAPTVYTSVYGYFNYVTSTWWLLGPGNNTLRVNWGSGATAASTLRVDWRSTWL